MHNHVVHLPGEHPVTRGEDLWPQGDGVGDVALNYFKTKVFSHLTGFTKDAILIESARLGELRKRFPSVVLRVRTFVLSDILVRPGRDFFVIGYDEKGTELV